MQKCIIPNGLSTMMFCYGRSVIKARNIDIYPTMHVHGKIHGFPIKVRASRKTHLEGDSNFPPKWRIVRNVSMDVVTIYAPRIHSYWAVINHSINMCMLLQSHPLLTCNQRWYKMGKKGSVSTENMQCLQYFVDTINCLHDWLRNDLMRKELCRRMYLVKKSICL